MNMLRNSGANNQVNLQGRNFLEKLLVHQLVKKFPAFDKGKLTIKPNPNACEA